ncbi:AAA family ATPase [Micromonosporaceae bacterium Da 78-11]
MAQTRHPGSTTGRAPTALIGRDRDVADLAALIGRDREVADLAALVDAAVTRPMSLLLLGDAGLGKSALLATAAAHAGERGFRVLTAAPAGTAPFGLLGRLLAPCQAELAALPEHLRQVLRRLEPPGRPIAAADEPLVQTGLLLAVDRLTGRDPVAILVDDAHLADPESIRALTVLLGNVSTGRLVLLLAARGDELPAGTAAGTARYELGPLGEEAAARLLDTRTVAPHNPPREEILRRAAGNPLALITFADPGAPVPEEFHRRLDGLAAATRRLLLHAAVAAEDEDVATVNRAAGGRTDLRDWQPAERAGLITVVDGRVRFRHPLVRAACSDADRADLDRAHLNLASLTDDPHHRAAHLAAATVGRFESIAAALEDTADSAGRRADHFAEARALQAAAERSRARSDAARRYARAVFAAYRAGDPGWAVELHRKAAALTGDPDVLGAAACGAALAMIHSAQPARAFALARQAVLDRPGDGQVAMTAVAVAATAALISGAAGPREQLPGLLMLVDSSRPGPLGRAMLPYAANPAARASVLAVVDPTGQDWSVDDPDTPMTGLAEVARMLFTGTVAWLRDDSGPAVAELHTVWQAQLRSGAPGTIIARLPLLVTAMIDSGKWAEADEVLDEAGRLAAVGDVRLLRIVQPALRATLRALRGRPAAVDGPDPVVPPGNALADSLRRRAAGLSVLAAGDHPAAYRHFRALFDETGEPTHYVLGPRSLPQLALTAARTGNTDQAARILDGCRRRAGTAPSSRMAMLLAHAAALLDDGDGAEDHFRRAVGDPDRALRWPLEFAEAQLNFGRWLRGRRRLLDARPHLLTALDTFRRLGAHGHVEQTRGHLPAGGPTDTDGNPPGYAFTALTAQKQLIARLAAAGMSNREIADRLTVSPRTVGSHLYDIYPLLGISNRHQLRELLADRPVPAGTGS